MHSLTFTKAKYTRNKGVCAQDFTKLHGKKKLASIKSKKHFCIYDEGEGGRREDTQMSALSCF